MIDTTVQPWISRMLMPADPAVTAGIVKDFTEGFAGGYLRAKASQRAAGEIDEVSRFEKGLANIFPRQSMELVQERAATQELALQGLELDNALEKRKDALTSRVAAKELGGMLQKLIAAGQAASPEAQQEVLGWMARNPQALGNPQVQGQLQLWQQSRSLLEAQQAIAAQQAKSIQETVKVGPDGVTRTFEPAPRTQEVLNLQKQLQPGEQISVPGLGSVSRAAERTTTSNPLSTIGREMADLRMLEASGDAEAVQAFKAAQARRDASKGEIVRIGKDGTVEIIKGAGAGGQKVPQSVIADAMTTAGSVGNLLQFGREIVQLAKPGNVGVTGNLKRLYSEVVGQFLPVEAGDEFDFAQAVTFFRAGATKILRSDSQITDPERKSIIEDLPSKGFSESDETARRKAEDAMKRVAASAKRQLKQAGVALPADLLTIEDREEIAKQVREGTLSMEQAKRALMRKEVF